MKRKNGTMTVSWKTKYGPRRVRQDPPTLQEVGGRFGISRERVRQIESRLKRRFKAFLNLEGDDFDRPES